MELTKEQLQEYEKEYNLLIQKMAKDDEFNHVKHIDKMNDIFIDIILERIELMDTTKYKCCIEGCSKMCLYSITYKNNKCYICWYHIVNIINKY